VDNLDNIACLLMVLAAPSWFLSLGSERVFGSEPAQVCLSLLSTVLFRIGPTDLGLIRNGLRFLENICVLIESGGRATDPFRNGSNFLDM
jgi:hypothetical protein